MSSDVDREPLAERLLLLGTRTGLVLLLAMPLVVTEETFFPFVVGKSVFGRSVIEAVFAMWLVAAILYPRHRLPRSWLLVAFGVYVIVNFASGIAGVSLQRSLWSTYERMQGTVDLVHWMMLAVVLAAAFRSISDWTFLFGVNVMVSLLVALLGVAEHLDVSVPLFESISRGEGDRVSTTLGNPTYVGAYMIVNAMIGLALLAYSFNREPAREVSGAVRRRRRRDAATSGYVSWPAALRVVLVACIALDLWIVTLTGTRGATLGLAAGLIAFAVAYLAVGNVRAVKYAAAAVLAVVAVLALALGPGRGTPPVERLSESNVLVARLSSIGPDDGSIRSRLESVAIGLKAFAARPILGWGPENYIVPWGRYLEEDDRESKTFDHAHNKIIEETTTKGALGLVSYLSLWAIMLAVLYRRARTENAHLQLLVLLAGSALAAYFVQNLALFDTPATVLQFMLLFGFVVSLEVAGTGRTSKDETGDGHKPGTVMGSWTAPVRRAASWVDSAWAWTGTTTTRLRESRRWASPLAIVAAALALVACVYFVNYRAYDGARAVSLAIRPGAGWTERSARFSESIDAFPPLANYAREQMWTTLAGEWGHLTAEEKRAALAETERTAVHALEAEPQSWLINAKLAAVYLRASADDPESLAVARSYLDRARELAPYVAEVGELEEAFERVDSR